MEPRRVESRFTVWVVGNVWENLSLGLETFQLHGHVAVTSDVSCQERSTITNVSDGCPNDLAFNHERTTYCFYYSQVLGFNIFNI